MSCVEITYFVHSTSEDNIKGLASGWKQAELSEKGLNQAKEMNVLLKDKEFDVVFTSDLKRAIDSADIFFENKFIKIQDERLRECNYGDFDGKPKSFKENMCDFIEVPFPNGESYKGVEKRIFDFLKMLEKEYSGKKVAIVAHEAPQLAIEVLINGKSWEEAINTNWRKSGKWQPGWKYILEC